MATKAERSTRIHYGWIVMAMGLLTTIGTHGFGRMAYTLILPPMKDGLHLTYAQLGLLGTGNILRNHGLLTCGPSIPQCFNLMFFLENACRIQVDMLGCGRPLHAATKAVIERTAEALSGTEITLDNERDTNPNLRRDAQKSGTGYGFLEWPALLRSLDREDPSYRD